MDYFNINERPGQRAFSCFRDKAFSPLVIIFRSIGFTPNRVTLLGIAFLVVSCIFGPETPWAAPFLLGLYCLMDGLDGALARAMNTSSKAGALLDIAADQAGVLLVAAAAVYHVGANGVAAILFSGFYISFIIVVVYANELKISVPLFMRVKYPFYVLYGFALFVGENWLNWFMFSFAPYYTVMFFIAVMRIHDGLTARHEDHRLTADEVLPPGALIVRSKTQHQSVTHKDGSKTKDNTKKNRFSASTKKK